MRIQRNLLGNLVIMLESKDEELAFTNFLTGDQTGRMGIAQLGFDMAKQIMELEE